MNAERDIPEDDLHAYVDDALPPDRCREVERSFAADPAAARRVAALKTQRAALRAALAPIAVEPIPAALDLASLVAARGRATVSRSRFLYWRLAAAAIVLLVIGGLSGWFMRDAIAPSSMYVVAIADEASDTYAAFAHDHSHPVEFRADDRSELLRWIGDRLHRPVIAPDLVASGFRFMGGRLVATPHGPAGMFMYDDDHGTRILLLLRPMPSTATTPMRRDIRGDTKGFAWMRQGMGYGVVGPVTAEDLHPLADEIRRQMDRTI